MKKVAVVVGGGQTLGEFLCKGIADAGYNVAVADLNIDNANKVADAINQKHGAGTAKGFGVDATNEESVIKLAQDVDNTFNRTDLMVYSAGVAKAAPITNFALSDFQLSVNVNLTGYFLCAREFAKLMLKHNTAGRIIQINSKSGKVGSKHNSGNLLKSPMFQSLIPQYAKKLGIPENEVEQVYIDKVPLKRGCDYQDVLNVLLFYASDKASYCTGQSINITGGQVMF